MVQLTNLELVQAAQALEELAQASLPVAGALRVRRVIRAVAPLAQDVEAVRQELLHRHGRRGEDGGLVLDERGNVSFESREAQERFAADYQELMAGTAEVPDGVRATDLGDIQVKPAVLVGLGPLLEETDDS